MHTASHNNLNLPVRDYKAPYLSPQMLLFIAGPTLQQTANSASTEAAKRWLKTGQIPHFPAVKSDFTHSRHGLSVLAFGGKTPESMHCRQLFLRDLHPPSSYSWSPATRPTPSISPYFRMDRVATPLAALVVPTEPEGEVNKYLLRKSSRIFKLS